MLCAVERINRECGSHFGFVVNSIFPELIQCLEQSFNILFFVVVYYQIRFQEISNLIENIIVNQPFQLNEEKNSLFKTIITLTIFQSIDHCW
ncbi:unnamed protein product [Rotaria sp. Silwood2]|nr:unnamed protein product [Rotaria sp. Silwood2]CAF4386016.1 unnamed protein product [Rotaria sp. Silwood2]